MISAGARDHVNNDTCPLREWRFMTVFRFRTPLAYYLVLLAAGQALLSLCSYAETNVLETFPSHRLQFENGAKGIGNVTYLQRRGYRPLTLDLYFPSDLDSQSRLPLVLFLHGGAWTTGTPRGNSSDSWIPIALSDLALKGYVVAAAEYRLDGEVKFPGAIDDVFEALAFLTKNADRYMIDPNRIAAWGPSAGGQLAALAAVACGSDRFPEIRSARSGDQSSGMQRVCLQGGVSWYGVHDFVTVPTPPGETGPQPYLGCPTPECPADMLRYASPTSYVDHDDPPMLLIHGLEDSLVDVSQTTEFDRLLNEHGVSVTTLLIPGVDHGFRGRSEQQTEAARRRALQITYNFFDQLFKETETYRAPRVVTQLGELQGKSNDGLTSYLGIPFAEAPVRERRWRPPSNMRPWQGTRDASEFGPDCPQPTGEEPGQNQSEDCLTLNVVLPSDAAGHLPVLFYIHGGAFFVGSGRSVLDKSLPSLVSQGVVVVSPNYRLGRLGFFAHPALREESIGGVVANYWLMDQIAALKWVRDNISNFGGDPENVTLLGCSAGGSSVNSLLVSRGSEGLFHKAVVRSGGGLFNATRSLALAETQGEEFVKRTGALGSGSTLLTALRDLSAEQVLAADAGPPNFGAIIDGHFLKDRISLSFYRGEISQVPVMMGSTSNEASIFGLMGFDRKVLASRFGIDIDRVSPAYGNGPGLSETELLRQIQTDFIFTSANVGLSKLAVANGLPVYSYYFDFVPESEDQPGADHCSDMRYLFGENDDWSEQEQALARRMQNQLVQFMKKGDPNGSGLPHWPRMELGKVQLLHYGTDVEVERGFRESQLRVWFDKCKETGLTLSD
jgi:para-nitrobenzyl esterase